MSANRVGTALGRFDPVGTFGVGTARRTARLAIEEILDGFVTPSPEALEIAASEAIVENPGNAALEEYAAPAVPAAAELPAVGPTLAAAPSPARRHSRRFEVLARRWRELKGKLGVVVLAVALALSIGAIIGSGPFSPESRYNAELVAAQQGQIQQFGPAQVPGHRGFTKTRSRLRALRAVRGMARTF